MERRKPTTNWTVLLYAAGYNELAPEIHSSFHAITENLSKKTVVAAQIAKAPNHLVTSLRPGIRIPDTQASWHGTRRIAFDGSGEVYCEEMVDMNMADPRHLAEFIHWGMSKFPAKHFMLVISGHGAGFVGVVTDYARNLRLIMSFKGFAKALQLGIKSTGRRIDLLILDACHMHMTELWYELAHLPGNPVQFLITPLGDLRLEGMPLGDLISRLAPATYIPPPHLRKLLTDSVQSINDNHDTSSQIMLIELNRHYLRCLKNCISNYAHLMPDYLVQNPVRGSTVSLVDMLSSSFHNTIGMKLKNTLYRSLKQICLAPAVRQLQGKHGLGPSLYCPSDKSEYLTYKSHYDCLLFAQRNHWSKYLEGNNLPLPTPVPLTSIVNTMLQQNPGITSDQAWETIRNFGWLRSSVLSNEQLPYMLRDNKPAFQKEAITAPSRSILIKR